MRKTVEVRLPRQAQDGFNRSRSKTEPFSSFENGQGFCVCDLCGGSLRGESRKNALPLRNNREEARRRRGFHNKMLQFYQAKLRTAVGTPRDVVFCWDIILYAQVPPADDTTLSGSKLHELRRGKKKRHLFFHFQTKTIVLPRQARDKHNENSTHIPASAGCYLEVKRALADSPRAPGAAATSGIAHGADSF